MKYLIITIIIALILIPLYLIILLSWEWRFTPFRPMKWLCHDIMGWHEPDPKEKIGFDGCSNTTHCRWCGKSILQDSQGNWF